MEIEKIINEQREYFYTGSTLPYEYRITALKTLKNILQDNENLIYNALKQDLNKSKFESYMCELGIIYEEINYHLKHLKGWMKNKRVKTPISQFKSTSYVTFQPYGVALIISPWNYPVQLCIAPLVGAISAGNCAVIKPSNYTPNVSHAIAKIIAKAFSPNYITVVEGGREQNSMLLEQKFDYIFFTGSVEVGKKVMERASKHLTPISLELGGKSPVIVDESVNVKVCARRVAFGKILNAGQTCVAPDYAFVHKNVKQEFIKEYLVAIKEFFPKEDFATDMPRIVNKKHFDRLSNLIKGETVILGGKTDAEKLFIEPTLLDNVDLNAAIMQEEIFGPILPIIEYENLEQCINYIRSKPSPLALYLFTKNKKTKRKVLSTCSFGGGCINDTIIHLATTYMGFGGVGESGMGCYHGKDSFLTFSHKRSILDKNFSPDISLRYHPYSEKKEKLIKKFLK